MSASHASTPIMTVDLLELDFLSKEKYAPPSEIQIARDWVRNKNIISIGTASGPDVTFAALVAKQAQKHLYELLKNYRDNGYDSPINRLELLSELYSGVRAYWESYIKSYENSPSEKIQARRQHIQALLNQADAVSSIPNLSNDAFLLASIPFLYEHLSMERVSYNVREITEFRGRVDRQEFREFDETLKKMQNFFISENEETNAIIQQIWQEELLNAIPNDADKQAIISQLKISAHQGGFFFSAQTMFQEYVGRNKLDNGNVAYTIYGRDCVDGANARFYVENGKLMIEEVVNIKRILNEVDAEYIKNADDTPVFVLHVKHCISPQPDGTATLDILAATVDVYNEQAWNVTNTGFAIQKEKLLSYAQKYLERGHDLTQFEFFENFDARIDKYKPASVAFTLARDSQVDAEARIYGDKILRYVGVSFPKFAEGIAARVSSAQTAEKFLAMIELLQRMDRNDLAIKILQPYAVSSLTTAEEKNDQAAVTQKIDAILSQPDSIRQAFHYLQQRLLLPRSMSKVTAAKPMQKNEKLLYDYLLHYTLHGHDEEKLQAVLTEYPSIVSREQVEKNRQWPSHPMGDNIIDHIEEKHAMFAAQVKEKILLDYASDYITKQTHDDAKLKLLFKLYPDIEKEKTLKNYFFSYPQKRGEKLFRHIGEKYPEYAHAVYNSLEFLAKKEESKEFVFAIKLLRRMGHGNYAIAFLQPYAKSKLGGENQSKPSELDVMEEAKKVMESSASVKMAHKCLFNDGSSVKSTNAPAEQKLSKGMGAKK